MISPSSISRLVLHGEYPQRIKREELQRRMGEVFEAAGIPASSIEWPTDGVRPGLNGYWRKMTNTETGIAHFTISVANGASLLLGQNPIVTTGAVRIKGVFGKGAATVDDGKGRA